MELLWRIRVRIRVRARARIRIRIRIRVRVRVRERHGTDPSIASPRGRQGAQSSTTPYDRARN